MSVIRVGEHVVNGQGLTLEYVPVTTVKSANDLATAMYRSGHYPAGLSPCFTAGINGTGVWDDNGGVCVFFDGFTCDCPPDCIDNFKAELEQRGIDPYLWQDADYDERLTMFGATP